MPLWQEHQGQLAAQQKEHEARLQQLVATLPLPAPPPTAPPPPVASLRSLGSPTQHHASPLGGASPAAATPPSETGTFTPASAGSRAEGEAREGYHVREGEASLGASVEQLGRDNFYYKQNNRDLKRKLRERAEEAEAARRRNHELEAELTNLRAYLELHPGATPTRLNKKQVAI